MAYNNRPKYIENQLKEINNIFRENRLKYDEKYHPYKYCTDDYPTYYSMTHLKYDKPNDC